MADTELKPSEGAGSHASNDADDLNARLQKLEAQNARLLDESKTYKTRAQSAETKLADLDKQKLEEQGKYKERLEAEIAEKQSLAEKLSATKKSVLSERLRTEALRLAPDVHDVDDLLRQMEHKILLKVDEENLTVAGVDEYVKKVREVKPYLFKKSALPPTDNTRPKMPNGPATNDPDEAYLAELRATKTQAEFDAVVAKYGK